MSVRRTLRVLSHSLPLRGNLADVLARHLISSAAGAARRAAALQLFHVTGRFARRRAIKSATRRVTKRMRNTTAGAWGEEDGGVGREGGMGGTPAWMDWVEEERTRLMEGIGVGVWGGVERGERVGGGV